MHSRPHSTSWSAAAKAIEMLRAACPTETPPAATERLDAMASSTCIHARRGRHGASSAESLLQFAYRRTEGAVQQEFPRRPDQPARQLTRGLVADERSAPSAAAAMNGRRDFATEPFDASNAWSRPTSAQRAALDDFSTASARLPRCLTFVAPAICH